MTVRGCSMSEPLNFLNLYLHLKSVSLFLKYDQHVWHCKADISSLTPPQKLLSNFADKLNEETKN